MAMDWLAPAYTPVLWVIVSAVVMYAAVVLLARWSGVRSFARMSVFDIAINIAIGSLVATTVAAKNPPLLQGLAALATLYALQLLLSWLRSRTHGLGKLTDNAPILLMGPGGVLKHANMRVARVNEDDLRCHLRQANVIDLGAVQAVVMEGTGAIHVLHHHGRYIEAGEWILHGVRDYSEAREPATESR